MRVREWHFAATPELFRRNLSLRFIVVGCINTAFSYCILALLLCLNFSVELGSLVALLVGIFFSYYTQGTVVFRYTSKSAFRRFVAAWTLIYFTNLLLIRSLMAWGASSYAAAAMATGPVVVISFLIQKLAVFRQPATLPHGHAS